MVFVDVNIANVLVIIDINDYNVITNYIYLITNYIIFLLFVIIFVMLMIMFVMIYYCYYLFI